MDRGVYAHQLEECGVTVSTLNIPRGRLTFTGLFKLYRLIKEVRPNVVQTWMYHSDLIGGVVARLAGVKAIAWGIRHVNHDPAQNNRAALLITRLCAGLSGWVPKKIVSCSIKATRLHQALGYCPNKFINIPNGYALDKLKPDSQSRLSLRESLAIAGDAFVFGMVARFDPQKDNRNLIRALGQIKQSGQEFICLFVGVGIGEHNTTLMAELSTAGVTQHVKLLARATTFQKS